MMMFIAPYLVIAIMGFAGLQLYKQKVTAEQQLTETKQVLEDTLEAKRLADKSSTVLVLKLNTLKTTTSKQVTKLVQTPVTEDEACVSQVLRDALKETAE